MISKQVSRYSGSRLACLASVLIFCLGPAAGCATRSVQADAVPSQLRSRVSFERIPVPGAEARIDARHERTRSSPREALKMPKVPQAFIAAAPVRARVAVRITIDADGRVERVVLSPLYPSDAGKWVELLIGAIRKAASGWSFYPAMERTLSDGPDIDGDGKPDWINVVEAKPVSGFFDAVFLFSAEKGRGAVDYSLPSP